MSTRRILSAVLLAESLTSAPALAQFPDPLEPVSDPLAEIEEARLTPFQWVIQYWYSFYRVRMPQKG